MILKLDPRWPLVWRTPFSVQLGIDPPRVRLDDVTEQQERMLSALSIGVSEPGLALLADGDFDARDALLEALASVLLHEPATSGAAIIAVGGSGELIGAVARLMADAGVHVVAAATPDALRGATPQLAIVVAHFVFHPDMHSEWLRRDVPHLPVVFSDAGVTIGPIVEPGTGPCLLCLELHRRDEDEAWPAVATQLLGRRSGAESALLALDGAVAVARLALERLDRGPGAATSTRIDAATGEKTYRRARAHPQCGCHGIAHLVSAESTASADRPRTDWAADARRAPGRR